jgi:hypothetical protein
MYLHLIAGIQSCQQQTLLMLLLQVLLHDDTLEDSHLKDGFSKTKATFESRFDMLYDPPLTQKVPPSEEHPAVKYMGNKLPSLLGPFGTTKLEIWIEQTTLLKDCEKLKKVSDITW